MEGIVGRSYRTLAVVAAVIALGLWAHLGGPAALAWLIGVAVGVLTLAGTVLAVEGIAQPAESRATRRWPYLAAHIGKFIPAAALIWAVVHWLPERIPLLALGYSLPLVVIVLRFAGQGLNRKLGI